MGAKWPSLAVSRRPKADLAKRAWIDFRVEIAEMITREGTIPPFILQEFFVRWARMVRMRAKNDLRRYVKAQKGLEHPVIRRLDEVLSGDWKRIEEEFRNALRIIQRHTSSSRWLSSQQGIGPISTVALESFIDLSRCQYVSSLWQYVGLGDKSRRSNWMMKTVVNQLGASFIYNQNRADCFYGRLYRLNRESVNRKNEQGRYAALARKTNSEIGDMVYSMICRELAQKETVKIMLSHYHAIRQMTETGRQPPLPYPATHYENVDLVPIPNSSGAPELGGMIAEYNARLAQVGRIVIPFE
jgi:hypothetical protein